MFDPLVQTSLGGFKFQMYSCDFPECKNTSAVSAGSNMLPRRWHLKEGKHHCPIHKYNRKPVEKTVRTLEPEHLTIAANEPSKELVEQSEVNKVFKYTCLRCGAGSNTGNDWSLVNENITFCNKAACRNYAATHPNYRMLRMTERSVAFMRYLASILVFAGIVSACVPAVPAPVENPPSQAVTVSPANPELEVAGTQQFVSSEATAAWSVEESGGGTITATGLYTAPANAGTYHVVSTASDSRAGKSVVKVRRTTVSVAPTTASVAAGASYQFTASVTGPTDTSYTWSVQETNGGTITPSGLYTAPATAGTYHAVAKSNANPGKTASATITVTASTPITIRISPATATVDACGGSQQFGTVVTGTTNTQATWAVVTAGGGSINASTGLYNAPVTEGVYTIQATSLADNSKIATATVTIVNRVLLVDVTPKNTTLQPGQTVQLTATVTNSCGTFTALGPLVRKTEDGQMVVVKE